MISDRVCEFHLSARLQKAGVHTKVASPRKATASAAVQPNLQRILGYAEEEPQSSDEDPFSLGSEDEEDAVLDRCARHPQLCQIILSHEQRCRHRTV